MFFKKSTQRERANAHKAAVPAFIFYLLALGGHALYTYFQDDKPPVTFVILMSGLLVFFAADWLYHKRNS
ncbi:hypothetical protein [Bacillus pumilus]|uniref:hypothetical protein n=1 Tax=Bacillus pumilus TaxID=1408 RepID=UPI0011E916EC|nr:hypothetical protein [Bacillus pumilus]TYS31007.1 hypothetical protein FZC65_13755 [Bacillus pumilus]TYS45790.1 hypothetical protein FZC67_13285 [Bacillus pumilus]